MWVLPGVPLRGAWLCGRAYVFAAVLLRHFVTGNDWARDQCIVHHASHTTYISHHAATRRGKMGLNVRVFTVAVVRFMPGAARHDGQSVEPVSHISVIYYVDLLGLGRGF